MLLGTDIQAVLAILEGLEVDIVGLNCSTGPEDMRDAIRYLGENASVPVHCIPNAGLPLQGPDGETIFPETPEQLSTVLGEFVERHGVGIVGGCCGTTPEHIAALVERVGGRQPGARPEPGPAARGEHDDRLRPRPGAAADPRRGARQLAGLAQGEGDAPRRRLRRPRADRRGPGRGRRPRARRLRGADRAPGRGRADGGDGEPDLADPARADPDRFDRARGDRGRARADPRAGRSSTRPTSRRVATSSTGSSRSRVKPRRGADRADDRRGRDGEDRRAQARGRPADPRPGLRRARARPGAADLRRAHLHPDHRRGRSGGPRRSRRSRASAGSRPSCPG